jgi:hypothetical protein
MMNTFNRLNRESNHPWVLGRIDKTHPKAATQEYAKMDDSKNRLNLARAPEGHSIKY